MFSQTVNLAHTPLFQSRFDKKYVGDAIYPEKRNNNKKISFKKRTKFSRSANQTKREI